jgi:lipopolysaccharide/colanic/teichoic acid biosynthesis glycosyltransferase
MTPSQALPGESACPWPTAAALGAGPARRRRSLVARCLDLAVAGAALVLAAPVMALAAVLVKIESAGPAVFQAERLGLGGCRFKLWKLRTMHADADATRALPGGR